VLGEVVKTVFGLEFFGLRNDGLLGVGLFGGTEIAKGFK
jgi:hypothetical protein